jgi:hypothetical protein
MYLSHRTAALLLLAFFAVSCSTPPYENVTSGPVASIYIVKDSRPDVQATIDLSASCSAPKTIPYDQWIVVPANASIAFRKPFPVGLGICNAEGRIDVKEGDKIRVRFASTLRGLTMFCGVTATRETPSSALPEALRVRKACGE